MNNSTNRYTDQELLELLRIWATDYNRKPTQREIIAERRLPTHHTFINRFGSIKEALNQAGLSQVQDVGALHQMLGEHLMNKHSIIEEFVTIENVVYDFVVKIYDKDYVIDIVNVSKFDVPLVTLNGLLFYRELNAQNLDTNKEVVYIRISDLTDFEQVYDLR